MHLFVGSFDYDDSNLDFTHHDAKSNYFYYY